MSALIATAVRTNSNTDGETKVQLIIAAVCTIGCVAVGINMMSLLASAGTAWGI